MDVNLLKKAREPLLPEGSMVYDFTRSAAILDACDRVRREQISAEYPRSAVHMYPGLPFALGTVPTDWDGTVVEWPSDEVNERMAGKWLDTSA